MKIVSPTLKKLVKALNKDAFLSGESLGKLLNISRNAIWKHINQLTKYDIPIESVPSKGYRLKQPLILLDKTAIKKHLVYDGRFYPNKIELLGSIASTNDYLKTQPVNHLNEIIICLAEHQSAGKGRFGRSWHSPFGANIYLSCRWCIAKDISQLNGLSLAVAIAVINTLKALNVVDQMAIKWPNDILWQNKKLGGILLEINAEGHGLTQIILGIGLNINMPLNANANIRHAWTSLDQILKTYQDRNKIAGLLISHLLQTLEVFNEKGFASFMTQWSQYDYLSGKKIHLRANQNTITGTAAGINEQGHLLLQTPAGKISAYSAGEASLHATFKSAD